MGSVAIPTEVAQITVAFMGIRTSRNSLTGTIGKIAFHILSVYRGYCIVVGLSWNANRIGITSAGYRVGKN